MIVWCKVYGIPVSQYMRLYEGKATIQVKWPVIWHLIWAGSHNFKITATPVSHTLHYNNINETNI